MKKILIVDDQAITLKMTNHILETKYRTICASSGLEAISLYKKERPDMILTDLHMPQMSGFELLNTLQDEYAERIPIMFMTADSSDEMESKGFENGAVDYIRKPFRADVLLRRIENILQNAEQIAGLKRAAETDPMTGLLNKSSSQEEIGQMCRETPGMLMMIDLDSFKLVNDIYGHAMGDKILISFAEIIQSAIRATDLAGRMGGDEFIAYCQHVSDESVIAEKTRFINEEILRSAKEYMGEDMAIPLGASIGAVIVPDEGTDFLTLYKKADQALYTVKQNGKHGYKVYTEERREDLLTEAVSTNIANEMAVLGERSRKKGAYCLPYDDFRLLYRFLVRVESNYHKVNRFLVFSLDTQEKEDESYQDAFRQLYEVVSSSLRASDVVTERGKGYVLVLLLEAGALDSRLVIERIRKKWEGTGCEYEMNVENEIIK